jgi:hypothetical protein
MPCLYLPRQGRAPQQNSVTGIAFYSLEFSFMTAKLPGVRQAVAVIRW